MKKVQTLFQNEIDESTVVATQQATTAVSFMPISVQKMRDSNITTTNHSPRIVQLLQNVDDPLTILNYGQNEIATFFNENSDNMMNSIDNTQVDFIVDQLSSILKLVDTGDRDTSNKVTQTLNKIRQLFIDGKEDVLAKINTTETQINRVLGVIEEKSQDIRVKVTNLSVTYDENIQYYKLLTNLIDDGKIVLQIKQQEFDDLNKVINPTHLDLENAQRVKQQIDRLDKRLMTLEKVQFVVIESAPMIRNLQGMGYELLDKFEVIRTITIPMWKRTAKLYQDSMMIRNAAAFANSVDDANNRLLLANATNQKEAAIEVAKLSQRDVVDTDTLLEVDKKMTETIKEVMEINQRGRDERVKSRALLNNAKSEFLQTFLKR